MRADKNNDGTVSRPEALALFRRAKLPESVLASIWDHCDAGRAAGAGAGLDLVAFSAAMHLVYKALKHKAAGGAISEAAPAPQTAAAPSPAAEGASRRLRSRKPRPVRCRSAQ